MGKIIVNNLSALSDAEAVKRCVNVMEKGRISNYGLQYCYMVTFPDGVCVASDLNKCSDRFTVWEQGLDE